MLVSTKVAAEKMELSEYELRSGYRQGRYPALLIGTGKAKGRRLRWDLDLLKAAIDEGMETKRKENQAAEEDYQKSKRR